MAVTQRELIAECHRLCRQDLLEEAASQCHDYLVANPHDTEVIKFLADVYKLQGKCEEAESLHQSAQALDEKAQSPGKDTNQLEWTEINSYAEYPSFDGDSCDELTFFDEVEQEETFFRFDSCDFDFDDALPSEMQAGDADETSAPLAHDLTNSQVQTENGQGQFSAATAVTDEDGGLVNEVTEAEQEQQHDPECNGPLDGVTDELPLEEIIDSDAIDLDEDSEEDDIDWLELVSTAFTEEDVDEGGSQSLNDLYGVDVGGHRLDEWEKAKLMAYDVGVAIQDTSPRLLSVLYRIFLISPYPATRASVTREIQAGASSDDLEAAVDVRAIWQNHPEFANSFLQRWSQLGDAWTRTEEARYRLSWPAALTVVRALGAYPCFEEIERLLENLFEEWWESDRRRWGFHKFQLYLGYRTGALSGCLEGWPEWTFESDFDLTDPLLSEDDLVERALWWEVKQQLGESEYLNARPFLSS